MKCKKLLLLAATTLSIAAPSMLHAQSAFTTMEYLDVNLFKAAHLVHGDMWSEPSGGSSACEYPKGTGMQANYLGSLWLSGRDNTGTLHMSAQKYRAGIDYWPGPLDASGSLSLASSTDWAKIWKINASDISTYKALASKTVASIPSVILEWPAKGNIYAKGNAGASLSIADDMAPFVDTDKDGIYDPTKGDYPDMKGDQMLWWVFSDNGPRHDESKGLPLKVEFHVIAYAYNRGTDVDRMMFYEYTMYNKSLVKYDEFRFGLFSDADLGSPFDDYIAFDSSHRMGIEYNAVLPDAASPQSYGDHPPLTGLSFVEMPGDVYPSAMLPAGTFNYFDATAIGPYSEPTIDTAYYNIMHVKGSDGMPRPFDGNYAYPISKGAVMCDSAMPIADRRYLISSNDYGFQPGTKTKIAMVFMATDTSGNACGSINFKELTDIADTAWKVYYNPLAPLSTKELFVAQTGFKLYPNPATTTLHIKTNASIQNNPSDIQIVDALGKRIALPIALQGNGFEIDISSLAPGIYAVLYRYGTELSSHPFVKQ